MFNDYYPFGLTFNEYQNQEEQGNDFLYNGIELQTDLGWDNYLAEFRSYDPSLGRFMQIDPVIKLHESPYAWNTNNPISFADPLGSDSTQRANAVAKAQEFANKNPGNSWGFDSENPSPSPGETVDCAGMVGRCMVAGEESDGRYGSEGNSDDNGVKKIGANTEEISESEVQVGSLVILDNSKSGTGKPYGHIGIIDKVEFDSDGKITNMSMIDSGGRPSTGKSGPRSSKIITGGSKDYWGKRITGFRKFDTRPDVYNGGTLNPVIINATPLGGGGRLERKTISGL